MNDNAENDPRLYAIPDTHGHAKGEHKAFSDERPIPLSARMLFLWFFHACRRGWPRFLMVTDHMNYLTFEDPAAINLVRRALKLAQAGDLYGAAETASVEVGHAAVVSEGLRRGMRYSIGAEVDNDPRSRPDAQNIVDAMKPDGMIRSVHFLTIDHPTHGPNWNWPFDNPEFADVFELVGTAKLWELYMATLLDAIERLPGNIVGHFYVPAVFGHWPDDEILDGYENQLVDACEARGMAIELNTRFFYRGHPEEEKAKYLAAHRRLLAKCKAKNVGVAVGSDAHSPKDQGRAFSMVLGLLDECEINELVFPLAGRLARVALRVERKADPAPEPPSPPSDERKAARRARPLEPAAKEETHPIVRENAELPKAKSARPKRSKVKDSEVTETRPADDEDGEFNVARNAELQNVEPPSKFPKPPSEFPKAESPGELQNSESPGDPPDAESPFERESSSETVAEPAIEATIVDGAAADEPGAEAEAQREAPAETEIAVGIEIARDEPEARAGSGVEAQAGSGLEAQAEVETWAHIVEVEVVEVEVIEAAEVLVAAPGEDMVIDAEFEPIVSSPAELAVSDEAHEDGAVGDGTPESWSDEGEENVTIVVSDLRDELEAASPSDVESAVEASFLVPNSGSRAAAAKAKPPAAKKNASPKTKTAAKKPAKPTLKAMAKKAPPKKGAAKKAVVPKVGAKKPPTKKASPKKAAVRAAGIKKATPKKGGTKKVSSKKSAQRRR